MSWQSGLDPEIVRELQELSDIQHPQFFRQQIALFATRGRSLLEALRQGIETDEPDKVRAAAHALGGSAGAIGARGLRLICQSIEDHCGRARRQDLIVLHSLAHEAFDQALSALQAEAGPSHEGAPGPGSRTIP